MKLLLAASADPEPWDMNYYTAATTAAHLNQPKALELLVKAGCIPGQAIVVAASQGNVNCVKLLLPYYSDASFVDGVAKSALETATSAKQAEIVALIKAEQASRKRDESVLFAEAEAAAQKALEDLLLEEDKDRTKGGRGGKGAKGGKGGKGGK